jgi:hypothetical protein
MGDAQACADGEAIPALIQEMKETGASGATPVVPPELAAQIEDAPARGIIAGISR